MNSQETRTALERFYEALSQRDADTMAAMYAEGATFEDPVFSLRGGDIGKMWRALLSRAKDLSVSYTIAQAGSERGTVEWTARYRFGGSRPVVNVILSEVEFDGDRIVRQRDHFDFRRWAAQALGPTAGQLARFGWFRRLISYRANRQLGLPAH